MADMNDGATFPTRRGQNFAVIVSTVGPRNSLPDQHNTPSWSNSACSRAAMSLASRAAELVMQHVAQLTRGLRNHRLQMPFRIRRAPRRQTAHWEAITLV
eukprot:1999047-Pyramimonas_sp.AAC.1